jgi:signal transduction histidine kinase
MPEHATHSGEVYQAYAEYDRKVIQFNVQVGCLIGMLLMPVGVVLDYFVYEPHLLGFLRLRLLCSLLIGVFWLIALTPFGRRQSRVLGVLLALLPAFFISWMIAVTGGSTSPYYAGLNLVLLVVGFVVNWPFAESVVSVAFVVLMYVGACLLHGNIVQKDFVNALYFLVLTGVIVATGSYVKDRARFREFALRFELDKNRKALEESNQQLKQLDEIKSKFFANISHELRTPLTLLLAPLETLLHSFKVDSETRNLLQTMQSNGMRLLKLINDLLDLVRLESGRMQVRSEPLVVEDFIKGLASAARQVADDKRLDLVTTVDPALGVVLADRDKLEKILLNLVFNALKFTPAGGRVELRAEKRGEQVVLIVADNGMGIAPGNLPRIFDRFWQGDGSSQRKYQGVGIGLSLVKELVQIQGGEVEVKSEVGKGTTFEVRLPFNQATAGDAPVPERTPATAAPEHNGGMVTSEEWLANLYRRAELFPALTPVQEALRPIETPGNTSLPAVLVADDEPDMLRFLKSQLAERYRVLEAVDGQQAIEKAAQFLPDLIVLDMMMPEKDGVQACRELRERTSTSGIPIIMLTARADDETKLLALSAGASDFLTKPFSSTELNVRIRNLIQSHHYQRKLSKQNQVLESTIEQLKETETQLVQSEKLASLGRLSAGIIHEINNPLNFATTGLYTLRNKGKTIAPDQRQEYLEILSDVEDGIKRVKTIVSDLRTFSHPETESLDHVEVADVVGSALRFLSNEWKNKIRIEQDLPEQQTVWANRNKLIQVVINLLQNSLDALRTKTFDGEQPTICIQGQVANGRSRLVVRDNGCGIAAKDIDKIFDPFYTTKDVGKGMGLGLSICYRIVQELDGQISVRTEPGKFCEFTLDFPAKG